MAYQNGRLPASALGAIPGGHLRKDAAAAFNAMNAESQRRYGVTLHPLGGMSSYRTFAEQQYLYGLYRSGRGNLAAIPGTSNHGLGLAIDLATRQMRWIVDQIGAKYGFAKKWSDAPSEWWHVKWRPGVWKPAPAGPPTLRPGANGVWVTRLQNRLRARKVAGAPKSTGYYGPATKRAVIRFQKKKRIKPATGIVGPRTWRALGVR